MTDYETQAERIGQAWFTGGKVKAAEVLREVVGQDKRGNPPFEPSSYAAGMERRLKRQQRWIERATEAARWLLDGTDHEKQFAAQWWRDHFNQPEVVLSDPRPNTPAQEG